MYITVKGCHMCLLCLFNINNEDGKVSSAYCNFLNLLNTTVWNENSNIQILTNVTQIYRITTFSVGNSFKKPYQTRQWIPMFIGTPCILKLMFNKKDTFNVKVQQPEQQIQKFILKKNTS